MMRMLAWWGTKTSSSSSVMPARSSACWPILAIANDAQRKTGLPCITRCGITPVPGLGCGADDVAPVLALPDQVELLAVGAPHDRADAGGVAGSDDGRAGAVGEDEGGAAVGEVEDVGEPLDADHQDVAGAAGADDVGGQGDAVAEPGAGGGDVEGGGLVGAELVRDRGGDGGGLEQVADGGDDDAVDLAGVDAGTARAPSARPRRTSSGRSPRDRPSGAS